MGCNSSTAASTPTESAAGATLLKAHTAALNGHDSHRKTPDLRNREYLEDEEPSTPANKGGPWAPFQDGSQNGLQRRNCTSTLDYQELPNPIEGASVDDCQLVGRSWSKEAFRASEIKEVRFEEEPEKPCGFAKSEEIETVQAEPQKPCELVESEKPCELGEPKKPCDLVESAEMQNVHAESQKAHEAGQATEVEDGKHSWPKKQKSLLAQETQEGASNEAITFEKGDFVNIVGPAGNGALDLRGKTGRVVDVDSVGCIPYEVFTEDREKVWFKASSLEKVRAMGVKVTSDTAKSNSCCYGRDGIFQCCDATR